MNKKQINETAQFIADTINKQLGKEEVSKLKEERFRNALGTRLKTPRKREP